MLCGRQSAVPFSHCRCSVRPFVTFAVWPRRWWAIKHRGASHFRHVWGQIVAERIKSRHAIAVRGPIGVTFVYCCCCCCRCCLAGVVPLFYILSAVGLVLAFVARADGIRVGVNAEERKKYNIRKQRQAWRESVITVCDVVLYNPIISIIGFEMRVWARGVNRLWYANNSLILCQCKAGLCFILFRMPSGGNVTADRYQRSGNRRLSQHRYAFMLVRFGPPSAALGQVVQGEPGVL